MSHACCGETSFPVCGRQHPRSKDEDEYAVAPRDGTAMTDGALNCFMVLYILDMWGLLEFIWNFDIKSQEQMKQHSAAWELCRVQHPLIASHPSSLAGAGAIDPASTD